MIPACTSALVMATLTLTLTLTVALASKDGSLPMERLIERKEHPDAFIDELSKSEFAAIFSREVSQPSPKRLSSKAGKTLPLVFLHGMGDSCFNNGMQSITKESGEYMGVYSVCIPTGDSRREDTMNGFFMNMDANVDVFAQKVRDDPNLADGFNCIGLSQGNNVCRGYIQRYNEPVAAAHLSIHGPVAGVAALPHCIPDPNSSEAHAPTLCQDVSDVLAKLAYTDGMQDLLFQADYFRDVTSVTSDSYKSFSQMGRWNNEVSGKGLEVNPGDDDDDSETMKENFGKTSTFAMIKANGDTVVVPREGEWWGAYSDDYSSTLTMKETRWYTNDLFGLRSADEAGKLFFNSTEGNHLDFTDEELFGWLDMYL